MSVKGSKLALQVIALCAVVFLLVGCVYPPGYQEWQWRQYNPNSRPLPGDPDY